MGHFSMKISAPTGSILNGTQQEINDRIDISRAYGSHMGLVSGINPFKCRLNIVPYAIWFDLKIPQTPPAIRLDLCQAIAHHILNSAAPDDPLALPIIRFPERC